MNKNTFWLLLAAILGVQLVGVFCIPLMDIDAAQYASISREMLERNSFLQIYDLGKDYLDKNQDPIQIEITFSKFNSYLELQPQIPHELDQPSDPRFDEVKLIFNQD